MSTVIHRKGQREPKTADPRPTVEEGPAPDRRSTENDSYDPEFAFVRPPGTVDADEPAEPTAKVVFSGRNVEIPDHYRAATVHKDEVEMFKGLKSRDKDPRKSLHIDDVPIPELAPDEALVAVMASAINFNTVWTSIFEPVSTFGFLERYGRLNKYSKRHDLPYHIVGSDLSGVVLRTGGHVSKWKPGQEVVAHCLSVELEDADGHDDTMMDPQQRIWGFETNFGGLADLTPEAILERAAIPQDWLRKLAEKYLTEAEKAAVARGDISGPLDQLPVDERPVSPSHGAGEPGSTAGQGEDHGQPPSPGSSPSGWGPAGSRDD